MKQSVVLPWPSSALKPNGGHGHWSNKWRAGKGYKEACMWACKEQKIRKMDASKVAARFIFHPPGNYAYDTDNLIARMKYGQDAVAAIIGVDDSKWEMEKPEIGEVRKPGEVVIELEEADAQS